MIALTAAPLVAAQPAAMIVKPAWTCQSAVADGSSATPATIGTMPPTITGRGPQRSNPAPR
ncbi:hypothetical protein D3C83_318270 [compost metagenome]